MRATSRINRDEELEQLTNPDKNIFVVLNAPPEFGKSFLLEEANAQLKGQCLVVQIKCDELFPWGGRTVSERELLQKIWGRIGPRTRFPHKLNNQDVVSKLSEKAAEIQQPLLFMLDCADIVSDPHVADWFRNEFFPSIYEKRLNAGQPTRCIVSGRTVLKNWGTEINYSLPDLKKRRAIKFIPLEPFRFEHVHATINQRRTELDGKEFVGQAPANEFTHVAREVCLISGGHPDIVDTILNDLAKTNYQPDENYFTLEKFKIHANSVLTHAFQPIEQAFDGWAENAKACFTNLSVFRRYNDKIIEIVWTYTVDDAPYPGQLPNPFAGMRQCLEINCLIRSDQHIDVQAYIGNEYRRILERQLQLEDHNKWLALHLLALAYYQDVREHKANEQIGQGSQSDDFGRDLAAMIEMLYHTTVLNAHLPDRDAIGLLQHQLKDDIGLLNDKFVHYLPKFRNVVIVDYLNRIEDDDDVRSVLIDWGIQNNLDTQNALAQLIKGLREAHTDEGVT